MDLIPDKIEKEIEITLQQVQIAVASIQELTVTLAQLVEQIKRDGITIRVRP